MRKGVIARPCDMEKKIKAWAAVLAEAIGCGCVVPIQVEIFRTRAEARFQANKWNEYSVGCNQFTRITRLEGSLGKRIPAYIGED